MQFQDVNQTVLSPYAVKTVVSFSLWGDAIERPIKTTLFERLFMPKSNVEPENERQKKFSLLLNYEGRHSNPTILWYDSKELRDEDHDRLCDLRCPHDEPMGPRWFEAEDWDDYRSSPEMVQRILDNSKRFEARKFKRENGTTGTKYRFKPKK